MNKVVLGLLVAFAGLSVHAAEIKDGCSMQKATAFAKAFYKEQYKAHMADGQRVSFHGSESEEYTRDYLALQMKYIGANNKSFAIFGSYLQELNRDASLRMYLVSLHSGKGVDETQDYVLVRANEQGADCILKSASFDN